MQQGQIDTPAFWEKLKERAQSLQLTDFFIALGPPSFKPSEPQLRASTTVFIEDVRNYRVHVRHTVNLNLP